MLPWPWTAMSSWCGRHAVRWAPILRLALTRLKPALLAELKKADTPDKIDALQEDHDVGRAYSDTANILCANCHKQRTAYQYDHPCDEQDPFTRFYRRLHANVDLLDMMLEGIHGDLQLLEGGR